jgi:hypothetical protein
LPNVRGILARCAASSSSIPPGRLPFEAKGVGCEEYEREIDGRVAKLYGL